MGARPAGSPARLGRPSRRGHGRAPANCQAVDRRTPSLALDGNRREPDAAIRHLEHVAVA